ncbi:RNA-binding (RRM/RBD/RNP motif) family protein [Forsythia ovata]|uniref:RNA-binding (RRM/RBD/RNP motif) family protein n=1 Tax=Forsythia ovata TaxID=205694 RepID=A0ABD1SR35_9LAMI
MGELSCPLAPQGDKGSPLKKMIGEICGKQCGAALAEGNVIVKLLEKAGIEKIDEVTIKADPNNIENNRGFAFVEFERPKDAQIAFHKLQKKDIFGKDLKMKVEWAQPLIKLAEEEILKVPSSWDEENVKDYFKRFGEIENVVLAKDLPASRRKDFAFINYSSREAAH